MKRGTRNLSLKGVKGAAALTPTETHTKVQWTFSMESHISVSWTAADKYHGSEPHSPWISYGKNLHRSKYR